MKKLAKAQKNVGLANNQLSELNQLLRGFNDKLNQTNLELAETSLLKEIYIGCYMDQCSIYIGKMEEYSQWEVKPDKKYFIELFRVSKNKIIGGGNYFGKLWGRNE